MVRTKNIKWSIWSYFQKRKAIREYKGGNELKLNLGCGNILIDGYLNLDILLRKKGTVKHDITRLSFIPDNSVSEIVALDIVEHISPSIIDDVMDEWIRVLKSDGIMVIKVPDLYTQARLYVSGEWDSEKFSKQILGAYDYGLDAHGHKFAYDIHSMTRLMERHDCRICESQVARTPTTYNLIVLVRRK